MLLVSQILLPFAESLHYMLFYPSIYFPCIWKPLLVSSQSIVVSTAVITLTWLCAQISWTTLILCLIMLSRPLYQNACNSILFQTVGMTNNYVSVSKIVTTHNPLDRKMCNMNHWNSTNWS